MLDYYVIATPDGAVDGVLVEEFYYSPDHTTRGIDATAWTTEHPRWWSFVQYSLDMRADPAKAALLRAVDRAGADEAFRSLVGSGMPDEDFLRDHCFRDGQQLPVTSPLVLGADRTTRLHRILLAGTTTRVPELCAALELDASGAERGVVGTGGSDVLGWCLRRIGPGLAWCIDVTSEPGADLGADLCRLIDAARRHGLLPVVVERLA